MGRAKLDEIMAFIVDLLGKFELALTWDNEHLIIPSLLPTEHMLKFTNNTNANNKVSFSSTQTSASALCRAVEPTPTVSTPSLFPT